MAAYTVATSKTATLAANVEDTVAFTDPNRFVSILNHSGGTLYVRLDGVAPTVDGDNCLALLAGERLDRDARSNVAQVRLISSAAVKYTTDTFSKWS